jgi:hypothetical protein
VPPFTQTYTNYTTRRLLGARAGLFGFVLNLWIGIVMAALSPMIPGITGDTAGMIPYCTATGIRYIPIDGQNQDTPPETDFCQYCLPMASLAMAAVPVDGSIQVNPPAQMHAVRWVFAPAGYVRTLPAGQFGNRDPPHA